MADWNYNTDEAPEGELVETLSPGGMKQSLIRSGRLWFVSDRSMYVYYLPEAWRPVASEGSL